MTTTASPYIGQIAAGREIATVIETERGLDCLDVAGDVIQHVSMSIEPEPAPPARIELDAGEVTP